MYKIRNDITVGLLAASGDMAIYTVYIVANSYMNDYTEPLHEFCHACGMASSEDKYDLVCYTSSYCM